MNTTTSQYEYSPLGTTPFEIRLVRIVLDAPSDTLAVHIQQFPLDLCPPYLALSYAWGDLTNSLPCHINDGCINITRNLERFLRTCWYRQRATHYDYYDIRGHLTGVSPYPHEMYLWIDALCIDQGNVNERNVQVRRMKEIYEQAAFVIIWLGEEADESDLAMKAMRSFAWDMIREFYADTEQFAKNSLDPLATLFTPTSLESMKKFFDRPWWGRAWILQEATTPKTSGYVRVWCGEDEILWEHLYIFYSQVGYAMLKQNFGNYNLFFNTNVKTIEEVRERRNGSDPQSNEPLWLLQIIRSFDAYDPLDKIYSILGIAVDGQDLQIDYSKKPGQVYAIVARRLISRSGSLDILSSCQPWTEVPNVPSWAPDWSSKHAAFAFVTGTASEKAENKSARLYNADLGLDPKISFSADSAYMLARGFEFDVITEVSKPHTLSSSNGQQDVAELKTFYQAWRRKAESWGIDYPAGGSYSDAFARTICVDLDLKQPKSQSNQENEAFINQRRRGNKFDINELETESTDLFGALALVRNTKNRCLFRTSRAYIGLALLEVSAGDKICILGGAQVPFVLRPVQEEWRVVGECYVHGIMDGDAVKAFLSTSEHLETFLIG